MGQRRNHSKIRKYLAMDDNEITTYQNVYNAVKAVDTEMYCLNLLVLKLVPGQQDDPGT